MPFDPSMMELVLSELKQIRQSISDLREEVHSKFGSHATQLATIEEWISGHEKWAAEQVGIAKTSQARITDLEESRNQQKGATAAFRWIAGVSIAVLGLLEAWLHRGHP